VTLYKLLLLGYWLILLVDYNAHILHEFFTRKISYGLSHYDIYDNPNTSKITNDDIKEAFLAKEWNYFHLSCKKLDYLHLKDFLKYEMWILVEATIAITTTHLSCKIIAAYRTLTMY
jgi:hypothetical protein